MGIVRIAASTAVFGAALVSFGRNGQAYEFAVNARTIGQARSLHALRILGPDQVLRRRRLTQSIQLQLWDLAGIEEGQSLYDPKPRSGPRLYFTSYVRVDQDYGNFASGTLSLNGQTLDLLDRIPELQRNVLQLDMLYAYAGAEGLLDGRIDVLLGRQLEVQSLDWFSFDGISVAAHLPASLGVRAFGGLRVREHSALGSDAFAPDGTSGALCEEYVEGATPGSGAWRPIDGLPTRDNDPFLSDIERCPQRDVTMPTFGAQIFLDGIDSVQGMLSYRRSQSRSVGLLGEPDRRDFEDLGYYPNEAGQAPEWGVNEERVSLSLRAPMAFDSGLDWTPFAALRYSVLHGLVDEAHLGTRLRRDSHSLESELFYSVPTFDGDSIFNIFSTEPYSDARATWEYNSAASSLGGYVRGWGRRYHSEDSEMAGVDASRYAGGAQAGAQYQWDRSRVLRVDVFHEDGYGGLRTGGFTRARWQWSKKTRLSAQLSGIYWDSELDGSTRRFTFGSQLGVAYQVHPGFATRFRVEQNANQLYGFQLALFATLDLAFEPEL